MDDFEFDTIGGAWVKGADHMDEWVLIRVKETSVRQNSFTGDDETVMEADWAFDLLGNGPHQIEKGLLNSGFIAKRCVGKKLVVGKIGRTVPKQKGYQGAIILEQPDVPEFQKAMAMAKLILSEEKNSAAKPAPTKAVPTENSSVETGEQELQDLLSEL